MKTKNFKIKENDNVQINITLTNIPASTNVKVTYQVQGSNGLIVKEDNSSFTTSNQRSQYISKSITLSDTDDFLHVYVDSSNAAQELNEKNNYVLVPLFQKEIEAYLDINTGYPKVELEG